MNEKVEKIIQEIQSSDGCVQSVHSDQLTEDEIKYVVNVIVGGGPTMKAIAFKGIMESKNRREKLRDPNTTEINCKCCKKVFPLSAFEYREDGLFADLCKPCSDKIK